MLFTGAVAVALGLALSVVSPAAASSGPITQVTKSGIYKSVVTCPRWVGPMGGPVPLLAAPVIAKSVRPKPARGLPQPVYAPIARCTVVFLKDAPAVMPRKAHGCVRFAVMLAGRQHHVRGVCCIRRHGSRILRVRSCLVLDTGFGGMARQVSRHAPATARPKSAAPRGRAAHHPRIGDGVHGPSAPARMSRMTHRRH